MAAWPPSKGSSGTRLMSPRKRLTMASRKITKLMPAAPAWPPRRDDAEEREHPVLVGRARPTRGWPSACRRRPARSAGRRARRRRGARVRRRSTPWGGVENTGLAYWRQARRREELADAAERGGDHVAELAAGAADGLDRALAHGVGDARRRRGSRGRRRRAGSTGVAIWPSGGVVEVAVPLELRRRRCPRARRPARRRTRRSRRPACRRPGTGLSPRLRAATGCRRCRRPGPTRWSAVRVTCWPSRSTTMLDRACRRCPARRCRTA